MGSVRIVIIPIPRMLMGRAVRHAMICIRDLCTDDVPIVTITETDTLMGLIMANLYFEVF